MYNNNNNNNNSQSHDTAVNYAFLLKCMAAVTTAAVVTAMAIFLASSAKNSVALSAVSMLKATLIYAAPMPIFPLAIAVFGIIGGLCLMPLLYCSSRYDEYRQTFFVPGRPSGCPQAHFNNPGHFHSHLNFYAHPGRSSTICSRRVVRTHEHDDQSHRSSHQHGHS